jgi:catechol 2,3-dioxygenase-like lactoylglutathione lyase family enzyme
MRSKWSKCVLVSLLWLSAVFGLQQSARAASAADSMDTNPKTFAFAVVSVADIDRALELWQNQMGMEVMVRRRGADAALAKMWGIDPNEISDQALIRTPGATDGGIHLVRFRQPGKAVREGAAPTDLVPKSLDVWTSDIHAAVEQLQKAGYKFRSEVQQLSPTLYEVHMFGHDELNIVLLGAPHKVERNFSPKGFDAAPLLITISPDNERDAEFYTKLLGADLVSSSQFTGPAIEKAVGLPPGAGLDIRIMGDPQSNLGRIEIVQYSGAPQRNLYPLAKPPARGLLAATYFVPELESFLKRGAEFGLQDLGEVDGVYGPGRMATATSPAGLRITLFAPRQ